MREFLKAALVGGAFIAAASLFSGAVNPWDDGKNAILVEETYVVKPGDTLWDIAEEYLAKNTGTRRYILEYKEGIYENNPWLVDRKGLIRPGDELQMTYWVKGEEE
ncbi:peptidoglycan-binding protein LysM [Selenomonas sp. oral taxon 920]|uniref:LysM peptidoglycan-binding domain-containing protein n=1 Tax=Selenomonas sp. oral taxon 920 TaxID=1884263 RepID=UPI000840B852|nr:LysM domain-containing protein [Selenomonas sp. oral taxon 920]AOH47466.1 peptidoglycan-binding protein LysM [Selenomonas sp. oral taxon 920]